MIRASLRGLKGSAQEQANVKALLKLFALVPEDTHCPLEVLLLIFKAVHEGSGSVSIMHIRKWLRVLIDRSLVLGTIDRPSVHDLVLDFAVAQHSGEELRDKHRCVVEAFRATRPVDVHGRHMFDRRKMHDSAIATYVCDEVAHHLQRATRGTDLVEGGLLDTIKEWLGDVPLDVIVHEAGRLLGIPYITKLASSAEDAGDWWLAARSWAVVSFLMSVTFGNQLIPTINKSLAAIQTFLRTASAVQSSDQRRQQVHVVQLHQLLLLSTTMDITALLPHAAELEKVLNSQAAADDPMAAATLALFAAAPNHVSADKVAAGHVWYAIHKRLRVASLDDPDPVVRSCCFITSHALNHHLVRLVVPAVLAMITTVTQLIGRRCSCRP